MSARPQSRRIRQADIARLAGVSQTTVSLVLAGKADAAALAQETRSAVLKAARQLGYVADPAARRLAAGRNNLLGLHTFMPAFPVDQRNPYYPFLVGVEEEAAAQGYDLLLFTSAPATGTGHREDPLHRLRLADGCVLIGRHAPVAEVSALLDSEFPLVYIGRREEFGDRLPYVGADYVTATAELVRHLHMLGHRQIVYVRETDDAVASLDRERGFREAIRELDAAPAGGSVVRTNGSDLTADLLRGWLDGGVTAVIAESTDTLAAERAVQSVAATLGARYPTDFSFALAGSQVAREVGEPIITGYRSLKREMGHEAVRVLADLLSGEHVSQTRRQQLLACTFIEGETTGPPP
ncbi:MAG: LacI family DNA-binding transcriptional regulator [Streptomyces sp.]|uniref:LacI family DNA-binding transcriptional regulator n=1 Tax=Streptomyces sp. TaxID=1931 RepID=UPI003D6BF694